MSEAKSMAGKVILIVGGTGGLGLSAARRLVEEGGKVVVTGREGEEVERAVAELGEGARGLAGDAVETGSAESAVGMAVREFGRLDGLYHVAGGSGRRRGDGALHELTDEGWEFTMGLNLGSVMRSNRAAVRQFLAQGGGGVILNMGSVLGWSPAAEHFSTHAYAAAKAGIIGFSRSVAARYAREDIRVNVIAPGLVESPMSRRAMEDEEIQEFVRRKQPLDGGRAGRVTDLDEAAVFLLSEGSRFVTGQVLAVDGGWTVTGDG